MGGTSIGENTLEWASESTEPLSQEVGGGLFVCSTGSFRS